MNFRYNHLESNPGENHSMKSWNFFMKFHENRVFDREAESKILTLKQPLNKKYSSDYQTSFAMRGQNTCIRGWKCTAVRAMCDLVVDLYRVGRIEGIWNKNVSYDVYLP
jgi:hypothetical protein